MDAIIKDLKKQGAKFVYRDSDSVMFTVPSGTDPLALYSCKLGLLESKVVASAPYLLLNKKSYFRDKSDSKE